MTHNVEQLFDEYGMQLLVGYDFEKDREYYEETGNPGTLVPAMTYTVLTSVGLFIDNTPVPILDRLTEKQKEHIVSLLNYE